MLFFALGIERLKIHTSSAIFFCQKMRDSLNEMKAIP